MVNAPSLRENEKKKNLRPLAWFCFIFFCYFITLEQFKIILKNKNQIK